MKSGDITGVTGVPELTWCYNRNKASDKASAGRREQGWSGHWPAPGRDQVCSGGADLAYVADVGDLYCYGVGAATPEALCRIRIRSHILGPLQHVERGVGKWAGRGAGEECGALEEAREGEEETRQ